MRPNEKMQRYNGKHKSKYVRKNESMKNKKKRKKIESVTNKLKLRNHYFSIMYNQKKYIID